MDEGGNKKYSEEYSEEIIEEGKSEIDDKWSSYEQTRDSMQTESREWFG
jgi:hypothetical protein